MVLPNIILYKSNNILARVQVDPLFVVVISTDLHYLLTMSFTTKLFIWIIFPTVLKFAHPALRKFLQYCANFNTSKHLHTVNMQLTRHQNS